MKGIRKARKAAAQKITEMRLGQKGQETAAHPKIPAEPPIQGMAARPEIPGALPVQGMAARAGEVQITEEAQILGVAENRN